jgi:predicted flap endonuclease-1-like 5' DNA nuclease
VQEFAPDWWSENVTMRTPIFHMTPDFTPVVRMMGMQTRFAIETSKGMMKLAMLPWTGLPKGLGAGLPPAVTVAVAETQATESIVPPATPREHKGEATAEVVAKPAVVAEPADHAELTVEPVAKARLAVVEKTAKAPQPVDTTPAKAAPEAPKAEAVAKPATETPAVERVEQSPAAPAVVTAETPAIERPGKIGKPASGGDDLTVLNGVGPKLAEALHAEGIYTFAQVAAWSAANVRWVDENLPGVRGRASRNGWVAQAAGLTR